MRVLMFGWEFPPHISGGLGTASYGLTKGLASNDVDIIFVVPKAYGDEDKNIGEIVGANRIQVGKKRFNYKEYWKEITYMEVGSLLIPYASPEQYEKLRKENKLELSEITETTEQGTFDFSGQYNDNLLEEVSNYSIVAAEIATRYDFDLIHSHDWLTYAAGIAAKRVSGKPLIIHVHATEFDRTGEHVNQDVYNIERMGMENADKIITVSNLTKKIVIERYGIEPGKITTVYNAVEHNGNGHIEPFKKGVKEKIVTFLGRITFQKGPEYYVEAAKKVLDKDSNVRFVMAGSGDLMDRMVKRAAALGITDKFHFTGFLRGDDVSRMFMLSDVYVMPSVSEPFGISPLEAMRSNVPVIISKQSGVSEILKHAIKVDFWDVDAIADSIYGVLNYDALSVLFRKYAKGEVESLKWENAAAHVKRVYSHVIKTT